MEFLWYLILGGLAGWLAGLLFRGRGLGIVLNIIVGIIGGIVGGWLFSQMGLVADTFVGSLVTAVVGSVILLWLVSIVRAAS